jgi:hypothetical protein
VFKSGGAVNENVQAAERPVDSGEEGDQLANVGEVGLEGLRPCSPLAEIMNNPVGFVGRTAVVNRNGCAGLAKPAGDGLAEPASRTRYQRYLSR